MKRPNTTIYIPNDLKRELKSKAARMGITMNETIIELILKYTKS